MVYYIVETPSVREGPNLFSERVHIFSQRVCYVGLWVCAKALKYLLSEIVHRTLCERGFTFHSFMVLSWTLMDVWYYRFEKPSIRDVPDIFPKRRHNTVLPERVLCWTLPCVA